VKNFGWIGTWSITRRCNLDCTYCSPRRRPPTEEEGVDYGRSIERIARIGPKVLNVSGGEPTLVTDLPRILQTAKQRWNPYIRVVNNGTLTRRLIRSLPHFDRLVVSLDGPGEVNERTRGVSGDHVLRELSRFVEEARRSGHTLPEIVINNVVTTENVGHLRRLCEAAAGVDPEIDVAVSALVPTHHHLAIHMHPEVWAEFWRTYEKLRAEGFRLWHHFEFFLADRPVEAVTCYNQFFVVRFWPDGTARTCRPEVGAAFSNAPGYAGRLWRQPRLLGRAAVGAARLAAGSLRRGVDPVCHRPCNCEAWLDALFTGSGDANLEYYYRPLWGRFTKDEVDRALAFVHRYVNPQFPPEALAPLLKKP